MPSLLFGPMPVFRSALRDGTPRERLAAELEGDRSVFLAAELEGQIVGVVLGTHDGRKGWINRLAVTPESSASGDRPDAGA